MKTKKKQKPLQKSQRPTLCYNTLPIQVTRDEFNARIKPHLSIGSRGPKTKVSSYKIFSYVLYCLHTGIQWYQLPTRGISWQTVYHHHNRWSKDGSYEKVFDQSLTWLTTEKKLDLSVLHSDGSNVVAKKGARASATRDTNTREAKKPLISTVNNEMEM